MRPVESATAKYLDLYMNSEEHGQDQFDKWMYGQGRPHLSFDQLRSTAVFLPTLAEQHQIVAEVEARTTAIDHLEAELDRQIARASRLRQSILTKAFAGELLLPAAKIISQVSAYAELFGVIGKDESD